MPNLATRYYLVPLLLLLAAWSGWFLHQSSFEIFGERYYSLFDDAMISMTYAKNLTQGHGLNWAKFGDPVEGFSSPLWTFLMVPFQWLPIAWGKVSLAFGIFCFVVLAMNVVVLDRILYKRLAMQALLPRLAATFSLAFLYPLNYWTLTGMECGAQTLLFLWGLDQFLAFEAGHARKHLFGLGAVLAAALLLRMDMVFFVGWVILFMAPWLWKNPRLGVQFLAITGLPMLAYLVFRGFYFHDIFPNTYYLKLHLIPLKLRLERAWPYFVAWAKPLWLLWYALPLMMIPLRRSKAMWLSFALIPTYLAYNLYVGGDAWEFADIGANRFTIIVIPWALVILAAGGHAWGRLLKGNAGKIVQQALPVAMSLLVFLLVNGLLFVPKQDQHWDRMLVQEPPFNTEYQKWNVASVLDLNEVLGTANRAAVVQAGDFGYFADFELVDVLGYNDRLIAHGPACWDLATIPPAWYVPGHVKMNYRYIITELRPDYFKNLWFRDVPEMEKETRALLAASGYVEYEKGGWIRSDFVKRNK
jgi:hypothetical protein